MIKYRAGFLSRTIVRVEVIRETEKAVYFLRNGEERRMFKESEMYGFYDTFAEAKESLLALIRGKADIYETALKRSIELLKEVASMEEPTE